MNKILLSLIFVPFLIIQPTVDTVDERVYEKIVGEIPKPYIIANSSPVYTSNDVMGQNETKPPSNGQLEGSNGKWDYLLEKYDWNIDEAKKIMFCESSNRPDAVGDTNTKYYSYGLMQIRALPGRPSPEWLLVPENNIEYAYKLWSRNGWRDWLNCARMNGLL